MLKSKKRPFILFTPANSDVYIHLPKFKVYKAASSFTSVWREHSHTRRKALAGFGIFKEKFHPMFTTLKSLKT